MFKDENNEEELAIYIADKENFAKKLSKADVYSAGLVLLCIASNKIDIKHIS